MVKLLAVAVAALGLGCAYGGIKYMDEETGKVVYAARTIAFMSGNVATHESVDGKVDVILNKEANLGPVLRDLAELVKQGGMAYTGTSAAGGAATGLQIPPHTHPELQPRTQPGGSGGAP
jgi:hypothetical protein